MSTSAAAPKRLAFFERYLTVWVLVCMVVGVAFGKLLPGVTSTLEQAGVRPRLAGERAHRRAAVADDLPDDAEGGFQRHRRHRQTAQGADGDAVRELAGQAVQHGAAGVGVHAASLRGLD